MRVEQLMFPIMMQTGTQSNAHATAGIDQSKWGGVAPLWRDVMAVHDQRRLHAMVGGGDQVYTDGFFVVSPLHYLVFAPLSFFILDLSLAWAGEWARCEGRTSLS